MKTTGLERYGMRIAGWLAVAIVALSGLPASAYNAGAGERINVMSASIGDGSDTQVMSTGACGPNAAACTPPTLPLTDSAYAVNVSTSAPGAATRIDIGGAVTGLNTAGCTGSPSACITFQVVAAAGSLCTAGPLCTQTGTVNKPLLASPSINGQLTLDPANFVGGGGTSGWLLLSVTATNSGSETEYIRVDYTAPASATPQVCFTDLPGENDRRTEEGTVTPKYFVTSTSQAFSGKVRPNTGTPAPASPFMGGVDIFKGGSGGTLDSIFTGPYAAEPNNCAGAAQAGWLRFDSSVTIAADAETDVYLRARNSLGIPSTDDTTPPDQDDFVVIHDSSSPTLGSSFSIRTADNTVIPVTGGTAAIVNGNNTVSIEGTFSDAAPGRVYAVAYDTTNQAIEAGHSLVATGTSATTFTGNSALVPVTDYYIGWRVTFTSGALSGQSQLVQSYNGTTRQIVTAAGFTGTPAPGAAFTVSPMASATSISLHSSAISDLSAKGALKIGDIVQFTSDGSQANAGRAVRITQISTAAPTTTLTLAANAADGTPVVADPDAAFLIRRTAFAPVRGDLSACGATCTIALPGGASAGEQKAWDYMFTTGGPNFGRNLGVNDMIMIQGGLASGMLGRRWRITAVNTGARTLTVSSTAIDAGAALTGTGTITYFAYDAPTAVDATMTAVDGEDARGGYLCNPCSGTPFRTDMKLSLGPNFITIFVMDDAGRVNSAQFTLNYSTPTVSVAPPTIYFTRMMVAPTLAQAQSLLPGQACTAPSCMDLENPVVMGTGANNFSISAAYDLTVTGGGVDFSVLLSPGMAVRVGGVHAVVKRVVNATTAKVYVVRGTVPVGPLTGATYHRIAKQFSDLVVGTYEGLRVEGVAFTDPTAADYDTTGANRTPDLYLNGVNLTISSIRPMTDPDAPASGRTRGFHFTYAVRVPQSGTVMVGADPAVTVTGIGSTEYVGIHASMVTDTSMVIPGGLKSGDYIQVPLLNAGNRIQVIGVIQTTGACNGVAKPGPLPAWTCVRIPQTVFAGGPNPASTLSDAIRKTPDAVTTDTVRIVYDLSPDPKPETSVQRGYNTDRVKPMIGISGVSESYVNVTASLQLSVTDANLSLDSDNNPSTGPTGFRLYQGVYVLIDPTNPSRTTTKLNYDFSQRANPLNGVSQMCYPAGFFAIDDPASPTFQTGSVLQSSVTPKAVFYGQPGMVAQDSYYVGYKLKFVTGGASLVSPESTIVQYVGSTRQVTVSPPFTGTPVIGDQFQVYSWDKPRSVLSTVGTVLSSTQFVGTSNLTISENLYVGDEVTFTSGANAGQSFLVTAYNSSKRFTVTPGTPFTVTIGDTFVVRTRGRNCQYNPLSFSELSGKQLSGFTLGDTETERGGYRLEAWAADSAVPPNVTATSAAPVEVNFGVVLTAEQATVNDMILIFTNAGIDSPCPPNRYGHPQSLLECFMDPAFTTLQDNPTKIRAGNDVLNSFFDAFAFVLGNAGVSSEAVSTNPLALTALAGFQDLFPGLFSNGDPDSDIVTLLNLLKNGIDRQIFVEIPLITLDAMYDPDNDPATLDGIESLEPTFRTLLALDGGRFRVDETSVQDKSSSPFIRATPALLDVLAFSDLRSTIDVFNKLRVIDVEVVDSGAVITEQRELVTLGYDLLEAAVDLFNASMLVDNSGTHLGNAAFTYDANGDGIIAATGEVRCAAKGYYPVYTKDKLTDCYCTSAGAPADACIDAADAILDPNSKTRALGRGLYTLMNDSCAAEGYNSSLPPTDPINVAATAKCNASIIYKDPTLKGMRTFMHEILAPDPSTGISDLSSLTDVIICSLDPAEQGTADVRESPVARLLPTVAALVNQTGTRNAVECTQGGQLLPSANTASFATCSSSRTTLRMTDGFRRMECLYDNGTALDTSDDFREGQLVMAPGRAPAEYCTTGELIFPDDDAFSLLLPALEFATDSVMLNQINRLITQFPDTDELLKMLIAANEKGMLKRVFTTLGGMFDLDAKSRRSQVPECGTRGAPAPPACRVAAVANADGLIDSVNDLLTSANAPFRTTGTCAVSGYSAPCFDQIHNTPVAGLLDTFDELFIVNPPACCTCPKPDGSGGWITPDAATQNACIAIRGKDFDPQHSLWDLLVVVLMDETAQIERDYVMEAIPTMSMNHTGANSPASNRLANPRRFVPGPRQNYTSWYDRLADGSITTYNDPSGKFWGDDGMDRPVDGNERLWSTYWRANEEKTYGWNQQWPPDRAFPSPMMCANGSAWLSGNCPTGQNTPYAVNVPVEGDAVFMHPNIATAEGARITSGAMNGIRTHGRNPFDRYLCDGLNCCINNTPGYVNSNPRCEMVAQECGATGNPAANEADCDGVTKNRLSQKLPNPYIGCTNGLTAYGATARWNVDVQGWTSMSIPQTPVDCYDSADLLRSLDTAFLAGVGADLGASFNLGDLLGGGDVNIQLDFLLNVNQLVSDVGGLSHPPFMPTVNLAYKVFGLAPTIDKNQLLNLFSALFGARALLTGGLAGFIRYDAEDAPPIDYLIGSNEAPACSGFTAAETGNRTITVDTKLRLTSIIDRLKGFSPLVEDPVFETIQRMLLRMVSISNVKELNPALGLYQSVCDDDCVNADCGTGLLLWGQGPAFIMTLSQIEVLGFGSPAITGLFANLEGGPDREVLDGVFEILGDLHEVKASDDPAIPPGQTGMLMVWNAVDSMISPPDGSTVPWERLVTPPTTGQKEPFLYPLAPALYQTAGVRYRGTGYICNRTGGGAGCIDLSSSYSAYYNKKYGQVYSAGAFFNTVDCNPNGTTGDCDTAAIPDFIRITCTRDNPTNGQCVVGKEDGTEALQTFNGVSDTRSHTGHVYRIIKKISNDHVIIDAAAIDDPGIIVNDTQRRYVDFTLQTNQRTGMTRALRAIGRGILNDFNQDPDLPGFDALDLDTIIADMLRCDTEGLLLDTLMTYVDSDSSNGDLRRIRNAFFSLKSKPAVRDGMVDAIGNLLGATGGASHLGVEGRAPIAKLIPLLRDGAIEDPTEQLALQRSVDNILNPYNPESNARLNAKPSPCSTADPSLCVAFADPILEILRDTNATSAYSYSNGSNPLAAECWSSSLTRSQAPFEGSAVNNPCYNGGRRYFSSIEQDAGGSSMLKPFLGGAGLGGLDVRTKNSDGTCTPSDTAPTWTPKPDGILDECDQNLAPGDGRADLINRWDDGIADYTLSKNPADNFFAVGDMFWNRTTKPIKVTSATFYHSGRAGNAGQPADRRARVHVVVYTATQPDGTTGWSEQSLLDTSAPGIGWTPTSADHYKAVGVNPQNCDNSLSFGLAACAGSVYARRTIEFYVRPRAGFQTVGIYPPVTVPAPSAGNATSVMVYVEQTGNENIEIGLDGDSYFAPASQYTNRTTFEVFQNQAALLSGTSVPRHVGMVATSRAGGTGQPEWKHIRTVPVEGSVNIDAVPMIRLGFGYPVARPGESTDFEYGLPVLKLLFNTPNASTATNPQRLRPVQPLVDALLAMLMPIDVKSSSSPQVPVDCTGTDEIGDYVYLPRLGVAPFNLQTCSQAAVGLGCINIEDPSSQIGDYDAGSPYPSTLCSQTIRGMAPIDLDLMTDNVTPFELFVPLIRRLMLTTYADPDTTDSISNDIILFDTLPFFDLIVTAVPPLSSKEEAMLAQGTMTAPVDRILQSVKVLTTASADPLLPYVNFFPGVRGKTMCGEPEVAPVGPVAVTSATSTTVFNASVPVTSPDHYKGWSLRVITDPGQPTNVGQIRYVTGQTGTQLTVSPALPFQLTAGDTVTLTSISCAESMEVFDLISNLTRTRTRLDMTTGISTTESDMIRLVRNFSSAFFREPTQPLNFTPRQLAPRVIGDKTEAGLTVSDGFGGLAAAGNEHCAEGTTKIAGCNYLLSVKARQGQIPGIADDGSGVGGSSALGNAVVSVSRGTDPVQSMANALHFSAWNNTGPSQNGMVWWYLWNPPSSTPAGGNRPDTDETAAPSATTYTVQAGDVLEYAMLIPSTSHVRRAGVEIVFRGLHQDAYGGGAIGGTNGVQAADDCHLASPASPNTRIDPFDPNTRLRVSAMSFRDKRCVRNLVMSYDGGTDQNGVNVATNTDLSGVAVDKWLIRRVPLTRTGGSEITHQGMMIAGDSSDLWSGVYFTFDGSTDSVKGRAEAYLSFVRIISGLTAKIDLPASGALGTTDNDLKVTSINGGGGTVTVNILNTTAAPVVSVVNGSNINVDMPWNGNGTGLMNAINGNPAASALVTASLGGTGGTQFYSSAPVAASTPFGPVQMSVSDVKLNIYDGRSTLSGLPGMELCTTSNPTVLAAECAPTSNWTGLDEVGTATGSFSVDVNDLIRQGVNICPASECLAGAPIVTSGSVGTVVVRTQDRAEIRSSSADGEVKFPIRPPEMPYAADVNVQVRCGETEFRVTSVGAPATTTFIAQRLNNTYYNNSDLAGSTTRSLYFTSAANAGNVNQVRNITAYNSATEQLIVAALPGNVSIGDIFKIDYTCPLQTDPIVNNYMQQGGDSGPFTFVMNSNYAARPWKWRNITPVNQDRPVFTVSGTTSAIDDPAVVNNRTIGEPAEDDSFFLDTAIEDQFGNVFSSFLNITPPAPIVVNQTIDAEYSILMPRVMKAEYTGWKTGTTAVSQTVIGTGGLQSMAGYVWAAGDYLEYEMFYPLNPSSGNVELDAPSITIDMQSYRPTDGSKDLRNAAIFGMPVPDAAYSAAMATFTCTEANSNCISDVLDHRALDQNGVPAAPLIRFAGATQVKKWGTALDANTPNPNTNFYYRRIPIPPGMEISSIDASPGGTDGVADGTAGGNDPEIARASRIFLMAYRGSVPSVASGATLNSYFRNVRIGNANAAKKSIWDANKTVRLAASTCNVYPRTGSTAYCGTNTLFAGTSTGSQKGSRLLLLTESEWTTLLTNTAGGSFQIFASGANAGTPGTINSKTFKVLDQEKDPIVTLSATPPNGDYRNGVLVFLPEWNDEVNCQLGSISTKRSCRYAGGPGGSTPATNYGSVIFRYQGTPDVTTNGAGAAVGAARFCQTGGTYGNRCLTAQNFQEITANSRVVVSPATTTPGRFRYIYTMSPASGTQEVEIRVNTAAPGSCAGSACHAVVEPYAKLVPPFTWTVNATPAEAPSSMEFLNNYATATVDLPALGVPSTDRNNILLTARRSGGVGANASLTVNVLNSGTAITVSVAGAAVIVNAPYTMTGQNIVDAINGNAQAQDILYAELSTCPVAGAPCSQALYGSATASTFGPSQLSTTTTAYATDRTPVTVGAAPQRLQVKIYSQYDRPTVNRAVIDPSGVGNAIRLTARNAGDAGTGISIRVADRYSDCTTVLSGSIRVVGKQILIPTGIATGQTAATIRDLINNNADASALVVAEVSPTDKDGNGAAVWPAPTTPTGCVAFEAVLSPVNASTGSGTGTNPGVPGAESTRRPWRFPIPVTFQVRAPVNAIRMRGFPRLLGAYLGLRINAGIVNRPVVAYDKSLMADERDTLPPVCLCASAAGGVCGASAGCGALEAAENGTVAGGDGDNIIVLNQQAGYMPGDRIRIRGDSPTTEDKDFTARVAAVTVRSDSVSAGTMREWLELEDIKYLSEQCDMTAAIDNNSRPGLTSCVAGVNPDLRGEQIVWVNPNTAGDDKFCFYGASGVVNACTYDYTAGVRAVAGTNEPFGTGAMNANYRYLSCSSGNFDRGADGVWHHVLLYYALEDSTATPPKSSRYRSCFRNNYLPGASPDEYQTGLDAVGYWQTTGNPATSGRKVDEEGFSTQIGAVRMDYGDNGSGINGVGNKVHYQLNLAGLLPTDGDYNLIPGFLVHDLMIPTRPSATINGRMGIDFTGMILVPFAVNGFFPTGSSPEQHVVLTRLRTGITDYSSMTWVNPYFSQISRTLPGDAPDPNGQETVPTYIGGDTSNIGANVVKNNITPVYGVAGSTADIFNRRVIGIPRRSLWAGGYNNVQTRIVRRGDGTGVAYLKADWDNSSPNCTGATGDCQNVWARTGLFLAMAEGSNTVGPSNYREYYTRRAETKTVGEKMAIVAKPAIAGIETIPFPLSLPIYFSDVFYGGETVLPSAMLSNYSYFHSLTTATTDCPVATPPGAPIPNSVASCRSPVNPQISAGQFAFHLDRIEVAGARVKAYAYNAAVPATSVYNATLLYPAVGSGSNGTRFCDYDSIADSAGPRCAGGLSRPGGFATVRANDLAIGALPKDGSATADIYWPSFGNATVEVSISAPGVPAILYRRDVQCPAGGCPP